MEVHEDPEAGRFYVASHDLPAGEVVLSARATAAALSDSQLKTHCSACFKPCAVGECEGCKAVRFCAECRQTREGELALHEEECAFIKDLFSSKDLRVEESRTLRLLMRLLVLRAQKNLTEDTKDIDRVAGDGGGGGGKGDGDEEGGEEEGGDGDEDEDEDEDSEPRFEDVEELCCNVSMMPESRIVFFHNIVKQAKFLLSSEYRIGMDEGVQLLARVYCNAHEILNPDGSDVDLGFGVFVKACLFNHSCEPNCVWYVGNDGSLCVRTVRGVRAKETMTIAYWDLHEGTVLRRKRLEEEFHFVCRCSRCESPSDASELALDAWSCEVAACDGALESEGDKLCCGKCKRAGTKDRELEDGLRKAIGQARILIAQGSAEEARALLDRDSKKMHARLNSTHALRLKEDRLRMALFKASSDWGEVLRLSDAIVEGMRAVFGKEKLGCDLQYGYVLWQGVLARESLSMPRDETVLRARETLRVFASVLGSSHWYVRDLNSQVKKISVPAAGEASGGSGKPNSTKKSTK